MTTTTHAPPSALTATLLRGFAVLPRPRNGVRERSAGVMTGRRTPRLFRFAALLAALGMFLGWMETAVPDVHDGHGSTEPQASAWSQLSHGHPPASPEPPGHPPEGPHTCHCIHAHAPAMPAGPDDGPRLDTSGVVASSIERAFASVAPEPRFRPPVA